MNFSFFSSKHAEKYLFFQRWLKNPLTLGALWPSSRRLARFIASSIISDTKTALRLGGTVIEIGAGTGSFTKELLKQGIPEKQLFSIEIDPALADYLKKTLPKSQVLCGDARFLDKIVPKQALPKICAIVSGIPMMTIPPHIRNEILDTCFSLLGPEKPFYQFTYSPFSSIDAKRLRLEKKRLGTVWSNWPPATVWQYKKH